jgi:hypothetical protein
MKAGGAEVITKILIPPHTERTPSATGMNPGNAHAIAESVLPHFGANGMDSAHDFVT